MMSSTVSGAQCVIGTENYPNATVYCDFQIEKDSQPFGELVSYLRHSSKDNILQP